MSKRSFITRLRSVLVTYGDRVGSFHPNARLYLLNAIIAGAAFGVFRLLFNFFVLSMDYDETLLGSLITTSSLTALLVALPMGYLADRLGRKVSLMIGNLAVVLAIFGMVLLPSVPMFIGMNILMGAGQSLSGVTMGPFLMENSSEKERTYLFSFSSGLTMASAFVGNWLGGYLPTWMGSALKVSATATPAYASALLIVAGVAVLAIIPLMMMKFPKLDAAQRSLFAPIWYLKENIGTFGKLVLPMLLTSIGAGLIMPFMNVFFRNVYHQPDPVIGSMFAWGSLAMGAGLLIAPPIADRMGKIQLVVVTQALSIPFLFMLGFSPIFALSAMAYYIRLALMNMSGPVYQTFVMERVEPTARATVASLVSMSSNFGWAFSPIISGWIQVRYGFGPAFVLTIILYTLSIYFYWFFFWHRAGAHQKEVPV
jgi:MFS family permease